MTEQYKSYIQKVWREALSTEEKQWLLRQLDANAANWKASLQQEYQQQLYKNEEVLSAERSSAILQKLHERIHLMDEAATFTERNAMPKILRMRKWKWAAGIAAAILGVCWLVWQPGKVASVQTAENTFPVYVSPDLRVLRNKSTEIKTFTLEDGSVVKLSPASTLVWDDHFPGNKRNLRLSGLAIFDVAKNSRKPFSVTTGEITTTALGTKFMVNSSGKGKLSVHLFEGKVVLQAANGSRMRDVYLSPGQLCMIDQLSMQPKISAIVADSVTQSGPAINENNKVRKLAPLEFVQTPLEDVFHQLGQRYKVHFKYNKEEIGNDQVTGSFLASDPLEVTLKLLTTINSLSFSQYQDTILVSKLK
ncbi:FecR family protein [Pseudoflavitalea sp. G-6-1-2]|uniref:FecR family protein n=1 Tax=Pseudoflavitalea sp. G-6-1-2 TaxID=2728841 RepID=UPI00146C9998|nr:FecR family protein [Pseudoflavitalea sp. G-6-1-2]NML20807.1 FecR family protein [Pseudoflavitalea sp. G-6-1-2]